MAHAIFWRLSIATFGLEPRDFVRRQLFSLKKTGAQAFGGLGKRIFWRAGHWVGLILQFAGGAKAFCRDALGEFRLTAFHAC